MSGTSSLRQRYTFTSESVSEGHPDKVSDYIADSILDAHLEQDPDARVASEVLCKESTLVIAGEITSRAEVDASSVARTAIREIGYTDETEPFNADNVKILSFLSLQAGEIAQGVRREGVDKLEQGAGDQGIMIG
jgi:S-adenosylmethionine synthetase